MGFGIPTLTYLTSDEMWISQFFRRTHLSRVELAALIQEMPAVLRGQVPCRSISASLAVKTYASLNTEYLETMLGSINADRFGRRLMSVWSLKAFQDRNYLRFMAGVAAALQESFLTGKPLRPGPRRVTENLILHDECQLLFPLRTVEGIYERPTAKNISDAFDSVKDAIQFGLAVDSVSKKLVSQALSFDTESLRYMNRISGLGALSVLSDRLFKLYSDTLAIVQALPAPGKGK